MDITNKINPIGSVYLDYIIAGNGNAIIVPWIIFNVDANVKDQYISFKINIPINGNEYPFNLTAIASDKNGVAYAVNDSGSDNFKFIQNGQNISFSYYDIATAQTHISNPYSAAMFFMTALHSSDNIYFSCKANILNGIFTKDNPPGLPTAQSKGSCVGYGTETISYSSSGFNINKDLSNSYVHKSLDKLDVYNPNNPYPGGNSTDPGNDIDGTFNYTSDDTPIPVKPTTKVTDSGLVTLYAPTETQLKALGNYLWSDAFSLDSFKKLFNNPMDCILGLTMIPVNLPHGSAREITVGNIVSTVSCDICSEQYVDVDCGSFTFSSTRFTSSFLDFAPYTKCYLYLPFIGTNEISMDEWQNATMHVLYRVDVLTGAMMCYVSRNGNLYESYTGQCSENVPLSSNDFSTTIGSILGVAATAAGAVATVATAGAAAPAAAAAGEASLSALGARTGAAMVGAGISTATNIGNAKPSVKHGSATGGGSGILGAKYPYLIFIAPNMVSPNNQNDYVGFPSNKIVKLSSCSGYTEVQAVNLKIAATNTDDPKKCTPAATDDEMREIKRVLESGVIF